MYDSVQSPCFPQTFPLHCLVVSLGEMGGNRGSEWPRYLPKITQSLSVGAGDLKVLKPLETDLSVLCPSAHPPPRLNLCMTAGNDAATGEPPKVHGHLRKAANRTSGL